MKLLVQSIWSSTGRLGVAISALAVVFGVLLVSVAHLPQTAVVIGVMIVGFLLSLAASGRPAAAPVAASARHERRSAA
jgi:hypothetical protein